MDMGVFEKGCCDIFLSVWFFVLIKFFLIFFEWIVVLLMFGELILLVGEIGIGKIIVV